MKKNVLIVDNYDSFVYNLADYLGQQADGITVARNDEVPMKALKAGEFSHVVISPGPGNPTDPKYWGQNEEVIEAAHGNFPLLGVCLGHQGIEAHFGAKIIQAARVMHGKTSEVEHNGQRLFEGIEMPMTAMRYHSLVVDPDSMPEELQVDAITYDGTVKTIMAFHHRDVPTFGVQFHPESVGTPEGMQLLANFLRQAGPQL